MDRQTFERIYQLKNQENRIMNCLTELNEGTNISFAESINNLPDNVRIKLVNFFKGLLKEIHNEIKEL